MSSEIASTIGFTSKILTGDESFLPIVHINCIEAGSKGTGWLVNRNYVVTNEHVVRGAGVGRIELTFADGTKRYGAKIIKNDTFDLAVVLMSSDVDFEPLQISKVVPHIGCQVYTLGHPLAYNGPAPILTMGYMAGINRYTSVERLIVNGAFNSGNSGGPLVQLGTKVVCGVVVTKSTPIPLEIKQAIECFGQNPSGMQYSRTYPDGSTKSFSEAQIVAEIFKHYQELTQVVIGEAIMSKDLISFLDDNNIDYCLAL